MRKYILMAMLMLFCFCSVAYCADDGLQGVQTPFQQIMSNILYAMAVPITAGIGALVHCILAAILKKFKLQVDQHTQDLLTGAAETAVTKAEAWATSKKDIPSSNEKLNYAVAAMRTVLSAPMAKQFTNETLSHYVEEAVYKMFNQDDPNDPPAPPVVAVDPPKP